MPWRKVCFSKRAFWYCSCLICFLTTFFFTPFTFLVFYPPASRIEYMFGRRLTCSTIARPAHSSFNFPKKFLLAELYRRWSWGSQTCHTDLDVWPCPGAHPLSGSQEEGCQCPCREAGSSLHTALWAGCTRSRTSGAWRDPECSCPHTPGDWALSGSCGPE